MKKLLFGFGLILAVSCGPGPAGNNIPSLSDEQILSFYMQDYKPGCPDNAQVPIRGDKAAFCTCSANALEARLKNNASLLAEIRAKMSRDLKPGAPSAELKTLISAAQESCNAAPAASPSAEPSAP